MGKEIIGVIMIIAGLVLGVYLGLYVMFIGGIIDIVDEINAVTADGGAIAWGIVKICFASLVGTLSGLFLIVPGAKILFD